MPAGTSGWGGSRGYTQGAIQTDSCFFQNIQEALDAGLDVGVYFFSQAITPEEARLYAGFCLENDPLYGDYLDAQLRRLRRRLEGLHRSREDADCGTLPELIAALEKKKEALS